jgi:hypothetical protein
MNLKELTKKIQELNNELSGDIPTNIEGVAVRIVNDRATEFYFITREELKNVRKKIQKNM